MHYITSVRHTGGYTLELVFEDGSVRAVDLERHLEGEVFEALKDLERFRTAHLNSDLDTVVWENGADMCPDFLYQVSTPVAGQAVSKVAEPRGRYPSPPTE